jgi:hypothetical protein
MALAVDEELRHLHRRVERPVHRLGEERRLVAEEVDHERGVHAGLGGDCPDRGPGVAALREQPPGRLEDRLTGRARAGAAAGAWGSGGSLLCLIAHQIHP